MNRRNANWLQMLLRYGKKPAILALSMVVMITSVASGSLAWLTSTTPTLVNTFTYGNVWIDLEETDTNKDSDNNPDTNEYPMQPGHDIAKDPKITVFANSKDSWLFVELVKSSNFDTYLEYTIADGWKQLLTTTDATTDEIRTVYYYENGVAESDADQYFYVLKDNKVHVKNNVTQEQLRELNANTYPTLKITAYAVQKTEDAKTLATAAEAWSVIKPDDAKLVSTTTMEDQISTTLVDDTADPFIGDEVKQAETPPTAQQEQTNQEIEKMPDADQQKTDDTTPTDAQVEPGAPEAPGA